METSKDLLSLIYSDSKSSALIAADKLREDLGDQRVFAFGVVSTEEGPRSVKAGGVQTCVQKLECF